MFESSKKQLFKILIIVFVVLSISKAADCQSLSPTGQLAEHNPIKIEGEWKIMQGDNPEFKNPDYDDSAWQIIKVPSNIQEIFPNSDGYIWYRKWIYISHDKPLYNMGLRLGKIATTDETFINGHLVGSSGLADANGLDNEKIRIYQIPDSIVHFGDYNLVTVRVGRVYDDAGGIYSETVSLGNYSTLVNELIRAETIALIFSGIFLMLGLMSSFFFAKRQEAKEYLFFAIGAFSMGVYTFYMTQWRYILAVESIYDIRLFYAACFSVVPAFIRFTYEFLQDENGGKIERIFNYFSQGLIMYGAFMNVLLLIYNDRYFWRYADTVINGYVPFVSGFIAVMYLIYKAITGDKDSRIIIFASVIAFAFGILELVAWNLDIPRNISMWGLMVFLLLITMVLANRFFHLQREVEQYSTGLEKMVDIRTKQMKLMEDSRRRLLANISHDLRTPISSVLGHAELLLEDIAESPQEQRTYLKRIHSKMLGLNRLIQDLFELAKIESQQTSFRMKLVSAAGIVDSIYQKYLFDVKNAGVEFQCRILLSPDVMVSADADRLEQVFTNLISNAIRYTEQGGEIIISCELTYDTQVSENIGNKRMVLFKVIDDGVGIAPEHIANIFERFYRGSQSRQDTSDHSGLGLAIVKEILVAHGGHIWIDTEAQRGCTICFTLPISL